MSNWKRWAKERVELEKGLISRNDAADYLDVCVRTLDSYVASGILKSYTLGRLRKFGKTDLEAYISENAS